MRTCTACTIPMIAMETWRNTPREERRRLRPTVRPHQARGLCDTCYYRDKRHGHTTNRLTVRVVDVAEDWTHLADRRHSQQANVRALAPRLGMTETALERAILRAKRLGLVAA